MKRRPPQSVLMRSTEGAVGEDWTPRRFDPAPMLDRPGGICGRSEQKWRGLHDVGCRSVPTEQRGVSSRRRGRREQLSRSAPVAHGRGFSLFRRICQFGLVTISGIVLVGWAAFLTAPERVRDNC